MYLWVSPEPWPVKNTAIYNRDISPDRFLLLRGESFSPEIEASTFIFDAEVSKDKLLPYNYIVNTGGFPLVSQKVVDLLNDLVPDEIQVVSTEIRCNDGILKNYKGINVVKKIIGMDRNNSIFTTAKVKEEYISGIQYLTYLPNCLGQYSIARDADYFPNLLISEKIKLAFEIAKISKGINFVRPENYYGLNSRDRKRC
jgi:hypothetical protein